MKWLRSIRAVDEPFEGYQQSQAYRVRYAAGERGTALARIRPRSLMTPPGVPDFFTRDRSVAPGPVALQGRAWSGFAPIRNVEITTDGGLTWIDADLEPQPERYAWVGWSVQWDATAGEHQLGCRATDADGNVQPLEPEWNLGGYACNAVHYIRVLVEAS